MLYSSEIWISVNGQYRDHLVKQDEPPGGEDPPSGNHRARGLITCQDLAGLCGEDDDPGGGDDQSQPAIISKMAERSLFTDFQ